MCVVERTGLFEDFFLIAQKLKNQRVWLYGLNDDTKRAFTMLAFFDIHVEGFVIEQDYINKTGNEYLGKPIKAVGKDEYYKDIHLVDVFGNNIKRVKEICGSGSILFDFCKKKIILYGAGECGKKALSFLNKSNGYVVFVCDSQYEKIKSICNLSVVSPSELFTISQKKDYFLVVAIDNKRISDRLCELYKKIGYECSYFNSIFFEKNYTKSIWVMYQGVYKPVFKAWCLKYIQRITRKKVFLYSSDDDYTKRVVNRLKCLGVSFGRAVFNKKKNELNLYESNQNKPIETHSKGYIIWVLSGYESDAKKVLKNTRESIEVLYSINAPLKLEREYILDTHMGFCNNKKPQIIYNTSGDKNLRIAILGDSTADVNLLAEKSWPEYFLEEARNQDISCEIICASTCGYMSMQTLIQLERDIIPYKPDVVIGYTIVNEISMTEQVFGQAHLYQKYIFDLVNTSDIDISFFGLNKRYDDIRMGIHRRNAAEVWLDNNRMMNAICAEYGIKFYAFIPPVLFTKQPKSKLDMELLEYIREDSDLVNLIHDVKMGKDYSWLCDLTDVFNGYDDETYIDFCHVVEKKK
ncbi:MAG: hypothetical protein J6O04_08725 [Selenomonadaceae bacterium]|nr:hypothetical protein [Selenomonadaceae bacterium]